MPDDAAQLGLFAPTVEVDPPAPRRRARPEPATEHELTRLAIEAVATTDGLARVPVLRQLIGEAEEAVHDAIAAANRAGCSWRSIGAQLGVPHQTLHRRYGGKEQGVE